MFENTQYRRSGKPGKASPVRPSGNRSIPQGVVFYGKDGSIRTSGNYRMAGQFEAPDLIVRSVSLNILPVARIDQCQRQVPEVFQSLNMDKPGSHHAIPDSVAVGLRLQLAIFDRFVVARP